MHLVIWVINKLFLVKTIISKEGNLHFKRWRFFACPWFRIYLHKICRSDEDGHLHTHPWNFISFILRGGYTQEYMSSPEDDNLVFQTARRFDLVHMTRHEGHRITLDRNPTWTLVLTYGRYQKNWGYFVPGEGLVNYKIYREKKNNGTL